MQDKQGRKYAKISEVNPGTVVATDGDFTCLKKNEELTVYKDRHKRLSILCDEGHLSLEGQESDDGQYYVGLYLK